MLCILPRGRIDTLHVVLGDSAGGSLHGALDLKTCGLACERDPFYCGPLPPVRGLSHWRADRTRWFNETEPTGRYVERPPNLRRLRQALKRSRSVHLWAAIGLSEQLFLAFWSVTLRECLGFGGPIRVTVFERVVWTNGYSFPAVTLGHISSERFRDPPPDRVLAGMLAVDLRDLWHAATSPSPDPLLAYFEAPADTWPRRAARSLLNRYPDIRTGLTRWDEVLLRGVAKHAPNAIRPIGDTLKACIEEDESVGDGWLWNCLRRLGDASRPHPLVTIRYDGGRDMRHASVALTPAGESVLTGEANVVDLNGIDRWAGGVHLSSADDRVWFRDGDSLTRSVP